MAPAPSSDTSYWHLRGDMICSAVALDDVPAERGLATSAAATARSWCTGWPTTHGDHSDRNLAMALRNCRRSRRD